MSNLVEPSVFTTDDGMLSLVFTATVERSGSAPRLEVQAELTLSWESNSPPEPLQLRATQDQPATLAHASSNGHTVDGQLRLEISRSGQLIVWGEIFYGDQDERHISGGMAILSLPTQPDTWRHETKGIL